MVASCYAKPFVEPRSKCWTYRTKTNAEQETNGCKLCFRPDTSFFKQVSEWGLERSLQNRMFITLKVVSYKGSPPLEQVSASFSQEGGSIGRSPENDLVLADPEKLISRKHGSIRCDNGVYSFTDSSSGGTFSHTQNRLLEHETIMLHDGDRLKIGDYEILVTMAAAPVVADTEHAEFFPDLVHALPADASLGNPPLDDLFTANAPSFPSIVIPPLEAAERHPVDLPSFIGQPDTSPFHESFSPPEVQSSAPASIAEFDLDDLLKDLDVLPIAGSSPAPVCSHESPDFPDDLFGGQLEMAPQPLPAGQAGSAVSAQAPMAAPRSEAPLPIPPGHTGEPFADLNQAANQNIAAPVIPTPGRPLSPPPSTPATPAAMTVERKAAPPAARDAQLFQAFLEGTGIQDASFLSSQDQLAAMNTLGMLFREMVDGMMTALRARSELKSQLRVSVTTIRSANNNPLKFTATLEDAMKLMLASNHPGFIDPVEAVREGFGDIMNHQMAMTAGIQASLAEVLRRFDPQQFEKPFEEGIVFQKKAKCWDAYCKAYPNLAGEAEENFFGEQFTEVYEKQMRVLRAARKPT